MTKANEQNQYDLLYVPHIMSLKETYKCILTGVDVASGTRSVEFLKPKTSDVSFLLEAI